MEQNTYPTQLYHGTPYEIHTSDRPFLDPRLSGGLDEGDPEEGHVFATPDKLMASIYGFKNNRCIGIVRTDGGPVVVFDQEAPDPNSEGLVYEVSPQEGFRQTLRRGQPSGKWAIVESDMPRVRDVDGNEVPGIPVGEPVRRVSIRNLIQEDRLRVCIFTGVVSIGLFGSAARDALHAGAQTIFINEAIERGWLQDVTSIFLNEDEA